MAREVKAAEVVEETVNKPVVNSSNIEVSENGNKVMKMTHVALLKEVAMKKENIYIQLGMIEEAKHALLKDIDIVEKNPNVIGYIDERNLNDRVSVVFRVVTRAQ